MAEVNNQPTQKKRKGTAVFSRKSISIDLTPMVDLGFILVTFFVFTTTLSVQTAMDIVQPNDSDGPQDELCESCVMTVLLGKDNKIWYYEGSGKNADYKLSSFDEGGIRKLLADKKKAVLKKFKEDRFVLIIKPLDNSAFKNLVDLVDESKINMVLRYYIDEPGEQEMARFN